MATKQQSANFSPVLFMDVEGEPISFFLRPGPVKCKLKPLITAGGGTLCNAQAPGAILLIEPGEQGSVTESTAHWFVSTQYIYDCVEKDEQLDLEDYRFKPEVVQRHSARISNAKESGLTGGRLAYTAEDDAAILSYVSKHLSEIGGNRLWQEMEKKRVTGHSWQSMKCRHRLHLAKKRTEGVDLLPREEVDPAGPEDKVEGQEMNGEIPAGEEEGCSPQAHSKADLTRIEDQSIAAESMQAELAESQSTVCPQGEVEPVDPPADKGLAERTQVSTVEAETGDAPQPEGPCLNPLTDLHPILVEHGELETDKQQTVVSPQKESGSEDSPPDQPMLTPNRLSYKKPKEKRKTSPMPERRQTRRQLQLELETTPPPEPYGKRLRLSTRFPKQRFQTPKSSSKTKSANKTVLRKDKAVDRPPSQKARGASVEAGAEGPQEERGSPPPSDNTQTESVLVPQKEDIKKEKRSLGILMMAAAEFDYESDVRYRSNDPLDDPVIMRPTEMDIHLSSSSGSSSEPEPSLQQNVQVSQAPGTTCLPTSGQEAAAETVEATTNPHMFIFQNESQEEDSQSIFAVEPAPPAELQPAVNKDSAFSLTQVQLEEGKQCISELMKETNKDLGTVTKALLKTSGDFSEALALLLNPTSVSGPFWQCCDDDLLLSRDPDSRQQLCAKYSEELLAKRIMFLELEG
ncbi:telomeric repeat-binding factor 2-interacting protein 1 [Brachionichthys hirsutus]|uniref:telomeric repeat-binding factor 2-interacting protein 1 n=1 Tax=Brachionichthys hirsutus TaxID=412623 RepID=UPI003604DC28